MATEQLGLPSPCVQASADLAVVPMPAAQLAATRGAPKPHLVKPTSHFSALISSLILQHSQLQYLLQTSWILSLFLFQVLALAVSNGRKDFLQHVHLAGSFCSQLKGGNPPE